MEGRTVGGEEGEHAGPGGRGPAENTSFHSTLKLNRWKRTHDRHSWWFKIVRSGWARGTGVGAGDTLMLMAGV